MTTSIEPLTCPFVVVIDTREQLPFAFAGVRADARDARRPVAVPTQRGTLRQGDYSVLGMEEWVAVERKSAADLFGTLGQGRVRFESELARLHQLSFAAVVVEADWREILTNPPGFSRLPPKIVYRSVLAWCQRFPRVHWFMMPGRVAAEVTTFRILERFWKDRQPRRAPQLSVSDTARSV